MEHIVTLLARHGFDDIVVTVAFLANHIRNYFGDGSEFGVRMSYATEETPLGTAGSVRNAMAELTDERFMVISGDVLTDIDLTRVVEYHEQKGALATIGLTAVENPLEFGVVVTNEDGHIDRFLEKPGWGQVFSDTVNNGIFVLEPEIFDYIAADRAVDFSGEVFPAVLAAGKPLYGCVTEGYWEDVGTLEAYARAHRDALDGKVDLVLPGFRLGGSVWLGEGAEVDPAAIVTGPVVLGDHCHVEAGARIGPYTVVGNNVMIRNDVELERVVVHDGVYLGQSTRAVGTVIGRNSDLRAGVRCEDGVVLGEECFVGEHSLLGSNVKVYPFKTVEAGAVVNQSLVWESRGARTLFGRDGVTGLANVDITPELAARLAMAFGTTLPRGSVVTTSRDTSRAARMLKRAVMAGLNAGGITVEDLEVAPVPVTRFLVRSQQSRGAITVRLVPGDPQSVTIRFFDEAGADIPEGTARKIERALAREDFRRVFPGDIGDIYFPPRALEHYTGALTNAVDVQAIRGHGFKVVVDYSYGTSAFVMPNVLAKLGADVLAVNPYAATVGAIAFDRDAHAQRVADLVRASGSHLGAVLDPHAERISFIDDEGRVLTDVESAMVLLSLVGQADDDAAVALPVTAPTPLVQLAEQLGVRVVLTPLGPAEHMAAAGQPDVAFGADLEGGIIVPRLLPAFDAMAAFALLLELLARTGTRLSKLVSTLPPTHVAHEAVTTPSEQKGTIMRLLVEGATGDVVLIDGVKELLDDGWVLVVPDPEHPVTHVWAEAASEAAARRRAADHAIKVKGIAVSSGS